MNPLPPSFTLRQLSYLVAASDAGTIVAAADRMHVSPSAMSDAITELERLLGTQLCVRRKAQGLTLTSAGVRAVEDARRLLRAADELNIALRAGETRLSGPLAVGCFTTIAPTVLPALLTTFAAEHPGLDLETVETTQDQLVSLLDTGRLDIAFAYDAFIPGSTPREKIFEVRPHVLLPVDHRLAEEPAVHLEDLVDEDFIMLNAPPSTDHALGVFAERGLSPRIRHRTGNPEVVHSLVGQGLGYGMLLQRKPDYSHTGPHPIVRKEILPEVPTIGVVIMWSSALGLTSRAQAAVDFVKTVPWPTVPSLPVGA
jgi:DNA-binding transcriptional LysR family regulator